MAKQIDLRAVDPGVNYTLGQVAEFLNLSYGSVLKLKKNGYLKVIKIGKRFYVSGKAILDYIQDSSNNE